jgi:hypothetical protein
MTPILNADTKSTQFMRSIVKKGKERLDYFTDRDNIKRQQEIKAENIFNLSLKQIFENMSKTFIDLLNDILTGNIHSLSDVLKGDRILYLGFLLFFVALGIYIIDITS